MTQRRRRHGGSASAAPLAVDSRPVPPVSALPRCLRWLPSTAVGPAPAPTDGEPPAGWLSPDDVPPDLPEALRHLLVATTGHRQHTQHAPTHDHRLPGPRPSRSVDLRAGADGPVAQLDGAWLRVHRVPGTPTLALDHEALTARLVQAEDERRNVSTFHAIDLFWRSTESLGHFIPGSWLTLEVAQLGGPGGLIVGVTAGWGPFVRYRAWHLLEPRPVADSDR